MEMGKKSYKGLVVMFIIFIALLVGAFFLPIHNMNYTTLIIQNIMICWIAALTVVIYFSGKIYWYTGISYEMACKAGMDECRKYAKKHMHRFGSVAIIYLIYSVFSVIFKFSTVTDLYISMLLVIIAALSTISVKLNS